MQGISVLLVFSLAAVAEVLRWADPQRRLEALTGWLAGVDADWLPALVVLLLAPVCFLAAGVKAPARSISAWRRWSDLSAQTDSKQTGLWWISGLVFTLALGASWWAGRDWAGFPPAYHDEYSYLFQAETYLQGRWWLPSAPRHREWFDQVHVLNEGHFASRYFPGVGLWLAPFVAWGNPWLGYHLAQALTATLVFWSGRELSTNGTGLLAAVLFALSPGLLLFSNLLLAHHPALMGLLLFLWLFLRWLRRGGSRALFFSGCGLSYAMLCRPMTAAGFALPFGVLFAWWWLSGRLRLRWEETPHGQQTWRQRSLFALALSIPLLLGFFVLGLSNRAITGSWLTTPYQLYQEIYTPRHRYGFNNVVIGSRHVGPKVLDHYDRWAQNLTPQLAVQNVWTRVESSLRWTMGIVPLLLGGLVCLLTPRLGDRRWKLIWLSILSLHVVHLPYWFAGIMGWHYVFETAPLWILLFAEATRRLLTTWRAQGYRGLCWWWGVMLGVMLAVNLVTVSPVWPGRIERGMAELAFSRGRYHAFREQIETLRHGHKAIVFVLPDPADRHMDYVTNSPTLDGPVLVARLTDRGQLPQAAAEFPDRVVLVFDAAQWQFRLLNQRQTP